MADLPVDKIFGLHDSSLGSKSEGEIERTGSLRKRMSAFPRVDAEIPEYLNIPMHSHYSQSEGTASSGQFYWKSQISYFNIISSLCH